MISGLLGGLAAGSTNVDLGNATFNLVAALPAAILGLGALFFSTFGS